MSRGGMVQFQGTGEGEGGDGLDNNTYKQYKNP